MRIEHAFSLELQDYIEAERAHELYWNEQLTNKQAFKCVGEGCRAQITCANMDKVRSEMKRAPYYKLIEEHSLGCEENNAIVGGNKALRSNGTDGYLRSDVVRFAMKRPESHFHHKKTQEQTVGEIPKPRKLTEFKSQLKSDGSIATKYSLHPIVHMFHSLPEDKKHTKKIILSGHTYTFKELFTELTDGITLELKTKIYHGKAWMERKDKGVVVRFHDKCKVGDVITKPSLFIADTIVENSVAAAHWTRKIEEHLASKRPKHFYILTTPVLSKYLNKDKIEVPAINFPMVSMDFVDMYEWE